MFNALLSIGIYVGLVSAMAVVLATIMPRELDHDWPDDDR